MNGFRNLQHNQKWNPGKLAPVEIQALEKLLISNAVDQPLAKVDFRPVSGAKVFLKTDLLDCVDKNYVMLSMRSKLLANHCTLVGKADDAEIVMEVSPAALPINLKSIPVPASRSRGKVAERGPRSEPEWDIIC